MDEFSQVGIGGIFALLVIREVFEFMRRRKGENGNLTGEKPVEFWQAQMRVIVESELKDAMNIVASEIRILQNDTAKMRESGHKQIELLQQISNRLEWRAHSRNQ